MLLISDDTIDCDTLSKGSLFNDIEDVDLEGSGLIVGLFYDNNGPGAGEDFTGLWMSGYAYGQGGERSMAMVPYSDGYYFVSYGWYYGIGNTTWLRIDDVGNNVTGTFSSDYWSGDFTATDCGTWNEPKPNQGDDSR